MEKFKYKNKAIELEDTSKPKLTIDGEPILVALDEDANEVNAGELPYRSFKSVKELAEELVDRLVQREQEGDG